MPKWVFRWPTGVSTNHLYKRNRDGGLRLSDEAAAWRDEAIVKVREGRQRLPDGELSLTIAAFPPDRKRRDADNLIKLTQDAICTAYGIDDSRIRATLAYRGDPYPPFPRLVARLESWQPTAPKLSVGTEEEA